MSDELTFFGTDFEDFDDEPSLEQLEQWTYDGVAEATDGCIVEPDGSCPHGYNSWLIELGYV